MTMTSLDIQRARAEQDMEDMDVPRCGWCARAFAQTPELFPCGTCPGEHYACKQCRMDWPEECADAQTCHECGDYLVEYLVDGMYCSEACAYGDYEDATCASCDRVLRYRIVHGSYCSAYCEYVDREAL